MNVRLERSVIQFFLLIATLYLGPTGFASVGCGEFFARSPEATLAPLWSAHLIIPDLALGRGRGAIAPGLDSLAALARPTDDAARALAGAGMIEDLWANAPDLRGRATRERERRFQPLGENAGELAALLRSALQGLTRLEQQEAFESAMHGRPFRRGLLERAIETLSFDGADDLSLKLRAIGFVVEERGMTEDFWPGTEFTHPQRPGLRSVIVAPPSALLAMTDRHRAEIRLALSRGLSYRVSLVEGEAVSP